MRAVFETFCLINEKKSPQIFAINENAVTNRIFSSIFRRFLISKNGEAIILILFTFRPIFSYSKMFLHIFSSFFHLITNGLMLHAYPELRFSLS